jgi:ribonuclease Z
LGDDMAKVTLLGTGAALSDAKRENTYMIVQGDQTAVLVDCAGSPTQRLLKAGVPLERVGHIILTHHHPDHMYGLSVLLLDLWLQGRKDALHLYGLVQTLDAAKGIMQAFEWERWQEHDFYPVEFHPVPNKPTEWNCITSEFAIASAPTKHLLPTIAVRFVSKTSKKAIAYSSDTMVCDEVVSLAQDASILFHEATTVDEPLVGHSSARQAGAQAQRANAEKLVLVHLPPNGDTAALRSAARSAFDGPVVVSKDFDRFSF